MHRELPPFAALRAFEASARHSSFKRAAEELCVTQSAISHRIKELEDFLGAPLFHRLTRKIVLTERGGRYFAELGDVMDRIERATANMRDNELTGPLALRGTPAFVNRWLMPQIGEFAATFPGIELHISASVERVDFATEDIDLSVEWGFAARPGVLVEQFFETASFPVASPSLLSRSPPMRAAEDLRHIVLLHNEIGDAWPVWLAATGAEDVDPRPGPRFEHCDLMIQAAIDGQGVALAFAELARMDMESGRLVRLFDTKLPPDVIYSIATPLARAKSPRIAAMRKWLVAQDRRLKAGQAKSTV